jgi:hypothetical protein
VYQGIERNSRGAHPKGAEFESMKDLRSISLCNVVYKLVSKLANRLKCIHSGLICSIQSAFMSGRLISDNTILADEVSHFMNRRRSENLCCVAVTLDMIKAYHRVELRPFMLRNCKYRIVRKKES